MYQGIIKVIKQKEGYGFLEIEGKEGDLFFHATKTKDFKLMNVGDAVVYADIVNNGRGDQAVGVALA